MHELLTPAEMSEADHLTIEAGMSGINLMENAGDAVAQAADRMAAPGASIVIVAGPGNNGGDGFVAARVLQQRGRDVRVVTLGDPGRLKGDAAIAYDRWRVGGASERIVTVQALAGAGLIVDALFGAGLDRAVAGDARALIEAIKSSGSPVLSVDLPSGINGVTGAVMGGAVRARACVTFFRRKPGHVLMPGRAFCGVVEVADIGIPASVLDRIGAKTFANDPAWWGRDFPVPRSDGHKYKRGHAVVMSGAIATTGAARLAARAALRAGAGLVTIATPRDALAVHAAANLAVMVRVADGPDGLAALLDDKRHNAVVIGPGLGVGEATRALVRVALKDKRKVVLDADALTSFADCREELCDAIRVGAGEAVLTPHDGEFARLFYAPHVAASKLDLARHAAKMSGAIVVLKGPDTVIASPDGRAAINENAPPWLATAGAGDVLAGLIGGLLAQGMPAFAAASAGVWVHGAAATAFGPGLIAEDIPELTPAVYRDLFNRFGRMP